MFSKKIAFISLSKHLRLCPGDGACSVGMQQAAPSEREGEKMQRWGGVGGVKEVGRGGGVAGLEQTDQH